MTLSRRKPMRTKSAKAKRQADPHRLHAVAQLPCVICNEFGMPQNSPTEVHHIKSGRYSSRKTDDRFTVPLCHSHHNKLRAYPGDEEKIGFHNAQETWESLYGQDSDWLEWADNRIERMA